MMKKFIFWQCNLRQRNFRDFAGKPSEGTIASIIDLKSKDETINLRTVLMEKNVLETSKMFKFMSKKTHDPEERFLKAVKFFSSEYFENFNNFDGSFTATFSNNSLTAKKILKKRKFNVQFFESSVGYNFSVKVNKLKKTDAKWLYTYYHNSFFNQSLNENIEILFFNPQDSKIKKIN